MKQIPLGGGKGATVREWAIVDDENYADLMRFKWHNGGGYARRMIAGEGSKRVALMMHRYLLGLDNNDERCCDHINGDRLDNRKQNLRIVTHSENCKNRTQHRPGASGHRNVYWVPASQKWRVFVTCDGTVHKGGWHTNVEDAARAARELRIRLFPYSIEAMEAA